MDPRPADLEATIGGRTLTDALEAYARRLDAHDVRIRVHGTARGLGPHAATQVYRVGIEAMTSALRHAHADVIDVAVDADEERLRLLVTDNGKRLADCAQDELRSIGAMRARARTLGGRLELAHGPSGHGKALLLDVPRAHSHRPDEPSRRPSSYACHRTAGRGPPPALRKRSRQRPRSAPAADRVVHLRDLGGMSPSRPALRGRALRCHRSASGARRPEAA